MPESRLLDTPLETFGRQFVAMLLDAGEEVRAVYVALLGGSTQTKNAERLRSTHEVRFVEPLRARMSGPDADLRARMAAALVGALLQQLVLPGRDRDGARPAVRAVVECLGRWRGLSCTS